MTRKLRLEYPGACYHVINRGNYRGNVFASTGAKQAFERCLFEACRRSGWVLHAYVVMRNHYHLAVETPAGNLVAGMQWLQATFACRFNRLRREQGHLFQGRYKALLVEDGEALAQVCHYIHLNPVRAGIMPVVRLGDYRFSSFWHMLHPACRPAGLRLETCLQEAGELDDRPAGWSRYRDYLAWQAEDGPLGKGQAYVSLSKGWALGSSEFRAALIKDHALAARARAWESGGAREIKQLAWSVKLQQVLQAMGRSASELSARPHCEPWKRELIRVMKEQSQASNPWLAGKLGIQNPVYVSQLGAMGRRGRGQNLKTKT